MWYKRPAGHYPTIHFYSYYIAHTHKPFYLYNCVCVYIVVVIQNMPSEPHILSSKMSLDFI